MSCAYRVLLIVSVLVCASAARGDEEPPALFALTRKAVDDDTLVRTKSHGFSIERTAFSEVHARGGVLVGFDLGMRTWFDSEVITAIRPVYRTANGVSVTRDYGSFTEAKVRDGKRPGSDGIARVIKLRAKAGYAVWAMHLRTGLGIDAMSLSFRRIDGDKLDPDDSYRTTWVGNIKGGSESSVNGEGMPFVGVFGNRNGDRVNALGLIYVKPPTPAAKPRPVEKPRVVAAPPKVEKVEKPEPPRVVVEKRPQPAPPSPPQPKPAPVPPRVAVVDPKVPLTHRNPLQLYSVTLPSGWVKMLFVEQQQLAKDMAGLEAPDFAFRPEPTPRLTDAFIVISSKSIETTGRSFDDLVAEVAPAGFTPVPGFGNLADLVPALKSGEMIVQGNRGRLAWRTNRDGRDVLHVCSIGDKHAVTIECHSLAAGTERLLPLYTKASDSFDFDPAARYRPHATSSASTWLPMAVFAFVAAGVGSLGGVALLLSRKRKPEVVPKRRPAKEPEPGPEDMPRAIPLSQLPHAVAPSTGIVTEIQSAGPRFDLSEADVIEPRVSDSGRQFTCFAERAYRVRVLGEEVYFLDAGPTDARKFTRPSAGSRGGSGMEHLDGLTPDEMFVLADGEKNFRLLRDDIRQVRIEAPGFWDTFGDDSPAGRLVIQHQSRGEMKYDFRDIEEMRRAMELLPEALGKRVTVNAAWDRGKKKFVTVT